MSIIKKILVITLGTITFLSIIILSVYIVTYIYQSKIPLVEPISFTSTSTSPSNEVSKRQKIVYGFLPYWNIKTANMNKALTHVGYFSLTLNKDGSIQTKDGKSVEQGYRVYQSDSFENVLTNTQAQGQKMELVITMMDTEDISSFLSSKTAKENAVETISLLVKSQPISGINLDIEYAGTVTDALRDSYTEFVKDVRNSIKASDKHTQLSIDVFADSGEKYRIWDIKELGQYVDYIVVMAYDFHRSSSPVSGPVAPLFGSEKKRWDTDVMRCLKFFFEVVPQEKILLGIPFYGYEWRTVSQIPGSQTYPKSGGIATYKRISQLVSSQKLREQWDFDALSPFITYIENGKIQTIYYENAQSLSYKIELVNQAKLGGIAIWALGYEGNTEELWNVIFTKMK